MAEFVNGTHTLTNKGRFHSFLALVVIYALGQNSVLETPESKQNIIFMISHVTTLKNVEGLDKAIPIPIA